MIPADLRTLNLILRPFAPEDGAAVFAYWCSDPGWEKYNASVPSGFTEDDAENFVREMTGRDRESQPSWALVHEGTVVGVVSLSFERGHGSASVGYGIHAELRGRGLCAEAVREVLGCAFARYPELEVIYALTHAENEASMRVLEKIGFVEAAGLGARAAGGGSTFCLSRADWEA